MLLNYFLWFKNLKFKVTDFALTFEVFESLNLEL
jgi:hypothetical protein